MLAPSEALGGDEPGPPGPGPLRTAAEYSLGYGFSPHSRLLVPRRTNGSHRRPRSPPRPAGRLGTPRPAALLGPARAAGCVRVCACSGRWYALALADNLAAGLAAARVCGSVDALARAMPAQLVGSGCVGRLPRISLWPRPCEGDCRAACLASLPPGRAPGVHLSCSTTGPRAASSAPAWLRRSASRRRLARPPRP